MKVLSGMDRSQLELYTRNILSVMNAHELIGGSVSIIEQHIQFIETCSRNRLKISFEIMGK